MSIVVKCPDCAKAYKLDDKWAGRKVKCKACGAVMQVPATAVTASAPRATSTRAQTAPTSRTATPRKPAAAKPAPARKPAIPDDPFDNLDALAALETTGIPEPEAPVDRRKLRAAQNTQDSDPPYRGDDKIGPPVNTGKLKMRKAVVDKSDRIRNNDDAWISIPGEELIDTWAPIATIGTYLVFVVINTVKLSSLVSDHGGQGWRVWVATLFGQILVFGAVVPLGISGVATSARIFKFAMPQQAYYRMCGVVGITYTVWLLLGKTGAGQSLFETVRNEGLSAIGLVLAVGMVIWLGAFWIMFRLRPGQFAVATVFAMIYTVFGGLAAALGLGMVQNALLNATATSPPPGVRLR